jgi:phosphonate transport system substrate-binding protein
VWRSDPVIPNLNIAFATDLSADMRDELTRAFLSIAADEDGLILLSSALDMQVQGLQAFPDSAYDPLRRAVEQSGTILVRWLGK